MDRLLLTYTEPQLLTFPEKSFKTPWWRKIFNYIYSTVTGVVAVLVGLCVIDSIDTTLTKGVMTGVYAVVDFFAPDLQLFDDSTKLGFVSKIFQTDYRYISDTGKVYHIVDSDPPVCENGVLIYTTEGAGKIYAPADSIVKSVDFVDDEQIVALDIGGKVIVKIESKLVFGVTEGQYISANSMIGSYAGSQTIKVSFYDDGVLLADPLTSEKLVWDNEQNFEK